MLRGFSAPRTSVTGRGDAEQPVPVLAEDLQAAALSQAALVSSNLGASHHRE
jgi:hypothetical protein